MKRLLGAAVLLLLGGCTDTIIMNKPFCTTYEDCACVDSVLAAQ